MIKNLLRNKVCIRFVALSWLLIPLCLSPTHFAYAYLDPGSGSYLIQVVAGLIFGTTYMLKSVARRFFLRIKASYAKKKRKDGE